MQVPAHQKANANSSPVCSAEWFWHKSSLWKCGSVLIASRQYSISKAWESTRRLTFPEWLASWAQQMHNQAGFASGTTYERPSLESMRSMQGLRSRLSDKGTRMGVTTTMQNPPTSEKTLAETSEKWISNVSASWIADQSVCTPVHCLTHFLIK